MTIIQSISLYRTLQADLTHSLPHFRATKATLVHISHNMEDIILRERIPAMLFTGFQESSNWRQEAERYETIAEIATQVCIFAGRPLPADSNATAIHIPLAEDDPLRQEWFLLILSDRFSAVLCGLDEGTQVASEADRVFDTMWTMIPEQISAVMDSLEKVLSRYVPAKLSQLQEARAQFSPIAYDPVLMTHFVRDLITFEENLQVKLRRTQHKLAQSNQQLEATVRERTTQLEKANAELQHMNHLKDEFVANVSHELRTPVTSIKLYHHLIAKNPNKSPQYLITLEREVKRLEGLIDDLLFVSHLENEEPSFDMHKLDINTLMRQLYIDRTAMAQEEDITLTFIPDTDMVIVKGDQMMLARMLSAILTNCLNYTPAGGRIDMTTSTEETKRRTWATIRITDTGPGIPAEEQKRVFERFYRGSSALKRKTKGTGLGLSIAYEIAQQHDGTITINSDGKTGTEFVIKLPQD